MKTHMVPHSAECDKARIWVAVSETDVPPQSLDLTLEPGQVSITLGEAGWRQVTCGGRIPPETSRLFVRTVEIDGLRPGQAYHVVSGESRARFSTLPDRLPAAGERPLSILLSSCYYRGNDKTGKVGQAVRSLSESLKPDLKFLCGDQVYQDYPVFILGLPFTEAGLAESYFRKYLANWTDREGYQLLLSTGSTWFSADDHEFWNNYPNWTTIISNTWTSGGRKKIKAVAQPLFEDFQAETPAMSGRPQQFSVGNLSFFAADTRVFREEGERRFMRDDDLAMALEWLRSLEGPGVLVVGQPLFHKAANWLNRRFLDRALANYSQYKDLVRAIFDAKHSVLVLTGDVHFGRVARCDYSLPGKPAVFEVIASPASLVNRNVGGKAEDAPHKFPADPIPGIEQAAATTLYKTGEEHFATLHLTEASGRVRVEPRYWFPGREPARFCESPDSFFLS
jgi:hypothetical protein